MLHLSEYKSRLEFIEKNAPYVAVSMPQMQAVKEMSVRDPTCMTCLHRFQDNIETNTMQLRLPGSASTRSVVEEYVREFTRDVMDNFHLFGFSPFFVAQIEVISGDMDDGDGEGARFSVPVVPAFGTWDAYVVTKHPYKPLLVAFGKDDAIIPLPNGLSIHGMSAEQPRASIPPQLHVIAHTARAMPAITGQLQSPFMAVLDSYLSLASLKRFAVMAANTRAHPTLILHYAESVKAGGGGNGSKLTDKVLETHFADLSGDMDDALKKETYRIQTTSAERLALAQAQYEDTLAATARPGDKLGPDGKRLRHPVEDSIFTVPPGLVMAPQPPQPNEPGDLLERETMHIQQVSSVFKIPVSMVTPALSRGNKDSAEEDSDQLTRTMGSFQEDLKHRVEAVLEFVFNARVVVDLRIRSHASFEHLVLLYESGAITRAEYHQHALRKVGLLGGVDGGKPKKKSKAEKRAAKSAGSKRGRVARTRQAFADEAESTSNIKGAKKSKATTTPT